jgi:hypothetical protein
MKLLTLVLFMTACASQDANDGDGSNGNTAAQSADDRWLEDALPVLRDAGCVECHSTTGDFLAGPSDLDIRDTLLVSGQVDLAQPFQSGVLTKGAHEGRPLTASEVNAILLWLASE